MVRKRIFNFLILATCYLLLAAISPAHAVENQVSVTSRVPARPTDLQTQLELVSAKDNFAQDSLLEYRITYGTYLAQSTRLTIEASWELGSIEGAVSPTVDLLEYVTGSATKAYNSTVAIVDTANRKISWTIDSFPKSSIDKTVSFKLKTKATYAGKKRVKFTVAAKASNPDTVSPFTKVSKYFLYQPLNELIGTQPTFFQDITVYSVASTSAIISVTTNFPSKITLRYGENSENLDKVIISPVFRIDHLLNLSKLKENTVYFFQIIGQDADKDINLSDIHTFQTAYASTAPQVRTDTIIITSGNNVLYGFSSAKGEGNRPFLIIPKTLDYELTFSILKHTTVKAVRISVTNKKVLGISTVAAASEANTGSADMVEVVAGQFYGKLKSPQTPGFYEAIVKIFDLEGNIVTDKLADLYVTEYLTVKNAKSQIPIEGAHVALYYYNPKLRRYEFLPPQTFPIKNPDYTNAAGQILSPLPQGKYKAAITAFGFGPAEAEFTIGSSSDGTYPVVELSEKPFSLKTAIIYYGTILADFLQTNRLYIETLSQSIRFFNLIATVSFGSLVLLTLLSFSLRTHIPLIRLPKYLLFHFKKLLPGSSIVMHIYGAVDDAHLGSPITQADVYIIDADKNVVVDETSTNKAGAFASSSLPGGHYSVRVLKKGYEPSQSKEYPLPNGVPANFTISLHKSETLEQSIQENVAWAAENIVGFCFELLLIASFIFEILFGYALGWQKVIPFLFVSLANLLLWLLYLRHAFVSKS